MIQLTKRRPFKSSLKAAFHTNKIHHMQVIGDSPTGRVALNYQPAGYCRFDAITGQSNNQFQIG